MGVAQKPVRLDALKAMGVLGGLQDSALLLLQGRLQLSHFEAGEAVFEYGDAGRELFLVLSGEVALEAISPRDGDERVVGTVRPGECFGEMSLIDLQPRNARARCTLPTDIAALHCRDLNALYREDVKAYALLVLNVARELSRGWRRAQEQLLEQ